MTQACEDANSKLVEIDADVDAKDRVGNSLLQIWKLRFGHKALLLFNFKILTLMLNRDSEIVICSRFVNCEL